MHRDRRIRYVQVDDAEVAYQVVGDGPVDLLVVPGLLNHIESAASVHEVAAHYDKLARFARVILFDKRGTGLSGPLPTGGSPTIQDRVDEAVAVLDAVDSNAAAVYATADGGPVGVMLAAMHPARVQQLVVYGSSARLLEAPGYPEGSPPEFVSPEVTREWSRTWGDDDNPAVLEVLVPNRGSEPRVRRALADMQRRAGSPSAAARYLQIAVDTDVRNVLPTILAPTLVLHVTGDCLFPVTHGRYLANAIPGARLVEIAGQDHLYFWETADQIAAELEKFITGSWEIPPPDRSFAIVMFTDIVESTHRLAEAGDGQWRAVLQRHSQLVDSFIPEFGGRVVKGTGDGVLATFDGPSRAAQCAMRLVAELSKDGIEIRAGLHAGEVEWLGDDIAGIAVHIAARVCALAGAQEILSTRTLRDLTAGSNIGFADRGQHDLRGVPGTWSVYAVGR